MHNAEKVPRACHSRKVFCGKGLRQYFCVFRYAFYARYAGAMAKEAEHWPRMNADDADQAIAHNPRVPIRVICVNPPLAFPTPLHSFIALASRYASCRKKRLAAGFLSKCLRRSRFLVA